MMRRIAREESSTLQRPFVGIRTDATAWLSLCRPGWLLGVFFQFTEHTRNTELVVFQLGSWVIGSMLTPHTHERGTKCQTWAREDPRDTASNFLEEKEEAHLWQKGQRPHRHPVQPQGPGSDRWAGVLRGSSCFRLVCIADMPVHAEFMRWPSGRTMSPVRKPARRRAISTMHALQSR